MDATQPAVYDATDYVGIARRQWWIIVATLLLALAGTAALLNATGKQYESSTSVLVTPVPGADVNVVGGRTAGEVNLDTEAQLVQSATIATMAAQALKSTLPIDTLISNVTVSVPANTSVLVITYTAASPMAAQAGSHAFAAAYLANRDATARAALTAQLTTIRNSLRAVQVQISAANAAMVRYNPTSSAYANQQSIRNMLISQANTLGDHYNQLATTTLSAGKIISDASLPQSPSHPDVALYLGSGAMVGLLLGVVIGLVRARLDRRVRRGEDVRRRAEVPVLVELPKQAGPRLADLDAAGGPGGRTFNRLRNEVLACMRPEDRVIVVAGTSAGPAGTLVAANLAGALARAGNDVALVGAATSNQDTATATLTRVFDVAESPGLTEVLAGQADLEQALQEAPRTPRLHVITTGDAASAASLLQAESVRALLDELSEHNDFVIVAAPSTATSADAQSLATVADAALLVVEARHSRHDEVADAAEQMRRVGAPVLGAVLLPRLARTQNRAHRAPARRLPNRVASTRFAQTPDGLRGNTGRIPDARISTVDALGRLDATDTTDPTKAVDTTDTTVLPQAGEFGGIGDWPRHQPDDEPFAGHGYLTDLPGEHAQTAVIPLPEAASTLDSGPEEPTESPGTKAPKKPSPGPTGRS
jgi:capsular exopolysaccharide synthesis family protein